MDMNWLHDDMNWFSLKDFFRHETKYVYILFVTLVTQKHTLPMNKTIYVIVFSFLIHVQQCATLEVF